MIARTSTGRKLTPLSGVAILFHRLEAVNAAHDAAYDGGNDRYTGGLLARRDALLQQFVGPLVEGGAS